MLTGTHMKGSNAATTTGGMVFVSSFKVDAVMASLHLEAPPSAVPAHHRRAPHTPASERSASSPKPTPTQAALAEAFLQRTIDALFFFEVGGDKPRHTTCNTEKTEKKDAHGVISSERRLHCVRHVEWTLFVGTAVRIGLLKDANAATSTHTSTAADTTQLPLSSVRRGWALFPAAETLLLTIQMAQPPSKNPTSGNSCSSLLSAADKAETSAHEGVEWVLGTAVESGASTSNVAACQMPALRVLKLTVRDHFPPDPKRLAAYLRDGSGAAAAGTKAAGRCDPRRNHRRVAPRRQGPSPLAAPPSVVLLRPSELRDLCGYTCACQHQQQQLGGGKEETVATARARRGGLVALHLSHVVVAHDLFCRGKAGASLVAGGGFGASSPCEGLATLWLRDCAPSFENKRASNNRHPGDNRSSDSDDSDGGRTATTTSNDNNSTCTSSHFAFPPNVEHLTVHFSGSTVSSTTLTHLVVPMAAALTNLERLRTLSLTGFAGVEFPVLPSDDLRTLQLERCHHLTSLAALLNGPAGRGKPCLQSLALIDCPVLGGSVKTNGTRERFEIILQCNTPKKAVEDEAAKARRAKTAVPWSACPALIALNLSYCGPVDLSLLQGHPTLTSLIYHPLADTGMMTPALPLLPAQRTVEVTRVQSLATLSAACVPKLLHAQVRSCGPLPGDGDCDAATGATHTLDSTQMAVQTLSMLGDADEAPLRSLSAHQLPVLRSLMLVAMTHITALPPFAGLTRLHLSSCTALQDVGAVLRASAATLEDLYINFCPQLNITNRTNNGGEVGNEEALPWEDDRRHVLPPSVAFPALRSISVVLGYEDEEEVESDSQRVLEDGDLINSDEGPGSSDED